MKTPVIATYGHGTENDFVIIFDPQEEIVITADQVAKICDRANGIGADGVIRITRPNGKWFMDYRNADGSLAEMCGNGIRCLAQFISDLGAPIVDNRVAIDTLAGLMRVSFGIQGQADGSSSSIQRACSLQWRGRGAREGEEPPRVVAGDQEQRVAAGARGGGGSSNRGHKVGGQHDRCLRCAGARHAATGGDRPRLHMRETGRETAGSLEFWLEMDVGEVCDPQAARPRRIGVGRRGHRSGRQACAG